MNDRIYRIIKHPVTIPISVGLLSFGAGVGVGFILGRRNMFRFTEVHEVPGHAFDSDRVESFIREREAALGIEYPEEVIVSVTEERQDEVLHQIGKDFVEEKFQEISEQEPEPENTEDEPIRRTLFAGTTSEWNYEEELKARSSEEPYVIHRDEFYGDEMEFTQSTLTYYSGDDIMVDEDDSPVYNYAIVVGELKFGHGSEDPNVFHVRNEKRRGEYEILYDPGLYSKEVLGLDIEDNQRVKGLKHSSSSVRRFKPDD